MHATQLEVLNEVARIATSDLELRPMLQRITDTLAHKFSWEFVALVTLDAERLSFRCEAVTSSLETVIHPGYGRPLGSGVVGHVAATGEPVLLDDVSDFPNYVDTLPGAQSELCVPVKHHGKLVAVLNLESQRVAAFRGQLPLVETVADTIAGAIASAQLYDELRERAQLMQMMSEVSRAALDATDLDEVMRRIVAYIHERFPLELVSVEAAGKVWASGQPGSKSLHLPIRFRGEMVGLLKLESATSDVFSPANVLAFEAFADQVAGAINLASLNAQLEQKTRDLEQANEHLAGAIETLHHISTQDGLTGVANRRHFDDLLQLEWRRAARSQKPLSLLMLDIDYFKNFNDSAGHQAGDDCLRRVAQTLRECVHRAADLVARYGGEEFAILLPETDAEHARVVAETLRERVAASNVVTASIGVATRVPPRDGSAVDEFVRVADDALYEAKRLGRNRVV